MKLGDGTTVDADEVLVAVGAAPNIALAEQAGLAPGTAACWSTPRFAPAIRTFRGRRHRRRRAPPVRLRIRTEHWANALKQPAVAAAGCSEAGEYSELPYFFTDQYDLGMEYVGHAPDYDRVVFRGDVDGREFTAFWLDGDNRVLAGMNVNIWEGLDDIKSLIRSPAASIGPG